MTQEGIDFEQFTRGVEDWRARRSEAEREAARLRREENDKLRVSREEALAAEQARTPGILERLRVEEILKIVRDDIWGEGKIQPRVSSEGLVSGLALVSDPYPLIHVIINTGDRTPIVRLLQEQARFGVDRIIRLDHNDNLQGLAVHVYDNSVYAVETRSTQSFTEGINQYGFRWGLFHYQLAQYQLAQYSDSSTDINPDIEDSVDKFNNAVLGLIERRKRSDSLPGQVRAYTESVIVQFPASLQETLRETGELSGWPLRNWVHDIRGSNFLYRGADRLLTGIGGPGLHL